MSTVDNLRLMPVALKRESGVPDDQPSARQSEFVGSAIQTSAEVQQRPRRKRIGYILRRFPSLSETFVLNEILGIEDLGTKLEVFSIMQPRDPKYHEGITRVKANIRYVPAIDDWKSLLKYNRKAFRTFGWRYVRVFARCLLAFRPLQIWRFLQAGYIAQRAHERRIEHFHAHFGNRAANVARLVNRISGITYSFTAHAVDIYKNTVKPRLLKKRMRDAEFVVTVSEENKRYLESLVPELETRIVKLYNGIDFERFQETPSHEDAPFTFLCVGRMVEKKGLEYLIEACSALKQQGRDFQCNIIGKGKLRPKLKGMIEELDLSDNINLVGVVTQDKIGKWFREADAFVLPCIVGEDGNREGLPVSIVEALASGLPVVSTPVAGIPEAVVDGENGLIVPERDADALAKSLCQLIDNDDLRLRLSENARPSVKSRFDEKKTTKALKRLLTRGLEQ